VQAWHKDHLVELGGGWWLHAFETESLPVRSEGIWSCVYVLNTSAVENKVEVITGACI
jgi:hypothetical protein